MGGPKKIRMFDSLTAPLDGTMLIEAGAGTGKTYNITSLVVRLVAELGIEIDRILVVTFTRAATRELKDRIRSRLVEARDFLNGANTDDNFMTGLTGKLPDRAKGVERLERALAEFDCAAIYTIDGFCQRTLRENAFESGTSFEIEMVEDQTELVREAVEEFWRLNFYRLSPVLALSLVDDSKLTVENLLPLARQVGERPSLIVEPQRTTVGDVGREFAQEIDRLRSSFGAEAEEMREYLIGEAINKQRKYNKDKFAEDYRQLGVKLARGYTFSPHDEMFSLLAESTVAGAVKKGYEIRDFATFEISEKIKGLAERVSDYALDFQLQLVDYVRQRLPQIKSEYGIAGYSDYLLRLRDSLRGPAGQTLARAIRGKYRAALIDEFQDTDPVQYEIFATVFDVPGSRLYLIGDPKQAIYGFRGADIFAYLKASAQAKDRKFTLSENWRSEPQLIDAVNALFKNGADERPSFVFEEIDFEPARAADTADRKVLRQPGTAGAPLQLWFVDPQDFADKDVAFYKSKPPRVKTGPAADGLARATAAEIRRLLDSPVYLLDEKGQRIMEANPTDAELENYRLQEKDIAVLVRKNAEAPAIKQALAAVGIGGVVYGEGNVFESEQAGELALLLAAVAEPGNERAVRALLGGGLVQQEAASLSGESEDSAALERTLGEFRDYHRLWAERGFYAMFRRFVETRRITETLLLSARGERKLTNLQHLAELLHERETELRCNMSNLIRWFAEQRRGGQGQTARQIRLENDEKLVSIITMHKAKGLEFPVVFCPYLWHPAKAGRNLYHRGYDLVLDLGSAAVEDAKQNAEREALAEDLRLVYVALTRAKNRCYLAWGMINDADKSAPAYLLHPGGPGRKKFAEMNADEARSGLQENFAGVEALDIVNPSYDLPPPRSKQKAGGGALACRSFNDIVRRGRGVASFSRLSNRETIAAEEPDYDRGAAGDAGAAVISIIDEPFVEPQGIFKFPKGADAGHFFHDLLENLDFADSDNWDVLIADKLKEHRYDPVEWAATVREAIERLLRARLTDGAHRFSLDELKTQDRLTEMEFVYPLAAGDARVLTRAFGDDADRYPGFGEMIERVRLGDSFGWMKGYIDLVFQSGGKYYLLDWKTNHLGNETAAYERPALEREMAHSMYILQYHIYLVALNRYLAARLPGYDYETHFGGVYYLFLRGISAAENSTSGVYFDRPAFDLVQRFDRLLGGQ